jgi:iron complex outermembrane receptor protein
VAQQSASAQALMEEIVVTARRREENLEQLPLSVAAISADAMQAQGVYNVQQLADFVPNLSLTESQRANDNQIFIRGIGGGASQVAQVFGTGLYVDGHYISATLGSFMSTVDIERVEVLRGPQGTLFGRNTTGGAVNIVSAKPQPDFGSYVTLRAGDYGQADLRAMINWPISDNVFARVNFSSEQTDGYYYNDFLNKDTNGTDQKSVGAALRWLAGDRWTLDARFSVAEDRDDNRGGQCRAYPDQDLLDTIAADGQDVSGLTAFADGVGNWGGAAGGIGRVELIGRGTTLAAMRGCEEDRAQGVYVTSGELETFSNVDNDGIYLKGEWDSDGPMWGLENANVQIQSSYRYMDYFYQQDRDYTPFKIDGVGHQVPGTRGANRTSRGFETIFTGQATDSVEFVTGLYYLEDIGQGGDNNCQRVWRDAYDPVTDTINGQFDQDLPCIADGGTFFERLPNTGATANNMSSALARTESIAVYGHVNWILNDQWELDFGLRWLEDERSLDNVEFDTTNDGTRLTCFHAGDPGAPPGAPPPTRLCQPVTIMNRAAILEEGTDVSGQSTFSDTTPMISLTRTLTPGDTLESGIVYFLISEGYLSGAFNDELNTGSNPELAPLVAYGPEHVTNYEVGFKGTLADGRVRLAADIFYMDYTDKQESVQFDNADGRFGPDITLEITSNASTVDIVGIELELRATPWDGGFVSLDLGMLDNEYGEFLSFNPDTLGFDDLSNGYIADRTPEWTVTASVEHAFQLANGATFTPQLGVYMQDEYFWYDPTSGDPGRIEFCRQDSYAKWRLRATYEPADANWQASLFGYNITDEEILSGCDDARSGLMDYYHLAPAIWGAEFTMRFGEG